MKHEFSTWCSGKLQPYIKTNDCIYILLKSGYFQSILSLLAFMANFNIPVINQTKY
jgi:hypothetical protein